MKTAKRIIQILLLLAIVTAAVALCGCGKKGDVDTSGMYLVVYHSNGGYLGNKTATERKLFCQPGSKIPNYPSDYNVPSYTVSSLGLAMRSGYDLLGWYTSAEYTTAVDGLYIALNAEAGSGVYEFDPQGGFVKKHIADENGEYIYVYFEEPAAKEEGDPEDRYVLITPQLDGEGHDQLTVEPGFYICNSAADWGEITDDLLRATYEAAFARRQYSATEAKGQSGWQVFADFSAADQTLFADFSKYVYRFAAAEASDAELDHYALVSGHASIWDVFVESDSGNYAFSGGNFVRVDDGDKIPGAQYYAVSDRYVFNSDTTVGFDRYDMVVDYWSFSEDRVTEDVCTWDGEKYVLHLYAHWEKQKTVFYHYNNGTGQVDESTTRLLDDNRTSVKLRAGEVIGRKEIIPQYAGHTFVGWSKSETAYEPWNFAADVFPSDAQEMHLYAYYVDGVYLRVTSARGLENIRNNPSGKFLIAEDIDLRGATLTESPFKLGSAQVFTGEILSFGKKISNFTMTLKATKAQREDAANTVISAALIPIARGAKISGLTIEASISCSGLPGGTGGGEPTRLLFTASGLIGHAEAGDSATVVDDCHISLTFVERELQSTAYLYDYTVGDVAAVAEAGALTVTNCTSVLDVAGLTGSVEIRTNKLAD